MDDWKAVSGAFEDSDFAHFQQGWSEVTSPEFRHGKASAAWTDTSLVVYAELTDDDIYNEVQEADFNKMAYSFGDVFEIFLKPSGQDSYFEIHISPRNHKLQLRLPFPDCFKKLKDKFKSPGEMIDSLKIWDPVVKSMVMIDRDLKKWMVVAEIPLSMLAEKEPVKPGTKWRFSFSRYDYTRPNPKPVYSSTSPHSAINYHLIDEYGILEFL